MRALTDPQYAFKAAVRRAVKLAGGPNAAAEVTRAAASLLSRYGNADHPEFAPVDVAFELDRAAGDHIVLRAWADLCGFELTPRNIDAAVARDLTTAAGELAREAGEVVASAIEAGVDGKVSINEAKSLDADAAELEGKVVRLRTFARAAMGGAA